MAGLLKTANEYASEYAGSAYMDIDSETENVVILLNCKDEAIQQALASPIAPDVAELAVSMLGSTFSKVTGAQVPIDGGNDRVI